MYLTYDTNQIPYGEANTVEQQQQRTSSAPPFRPRWLIRISDMKKVPGEQASKEDGYCALSYSWTWSGERVTDKKGNQTVEDKGKHQIISSTGIPQDAKFIDVLRKIAQDLNVKYLWFDRECVAMDQEEDKLNSLRTMDLTYSHADFTLALVPEMEASHELKSIYPTNNDNNLSQEQQRLYIETLENCLNKIITCEWSTRVWLLVEAMMSKRILYMGKDAHVWSDGLAQYTSSIRSGAKVSLEAIQSLSSFTTASHKDASKILWHAHRRNTSLDYDRVFALIHIFSTIDMPIRYGASEDLPNYMIEFYTKLIKKDWTMLCFGKQHPDYPCRMERYTEFMPSWTGISGTHIQHTSMAQVPETHQRSIVVKEYSSTKEKDDRGKICIDTGSFSFLSHGVLERIDNNSTSLTGNEKHLEERYGILWTHRFYKNKNDKNSIILLSLVIDDEEAEKENGCIVLDIPFVWQTCVVRPVIVKKKRSVNNGNSSSSSSEPFLYQSIGLSALLSPVALDHFGPVSETTSFIIQ
ncbi:hypothetical protein BDA99DRAFT_507304 [Phascolomyces articulosus]|uniref:Heterokaryon incompatibility domain-containing protein n=1 Tax=Phascolomyces articulosus TaxID=60185 RepID=A0AAD5PF22_9FUNG|nr:hypothetical protein BDA99DRAFT_507304 [Phascolomyces articulosus]